MGQTISDIDIPRADTINYSDVEEVLGYFLLWSATYTRFGGYNKTCHRTPDLRVLESQLRLWMKAVEWILQDGELTSIVKLYTPYVQAYRIYNGTEPEALKHRVVSSTIKRWTEGERTITSTDIVILIASVESSHRYITEERYTDYACAMRDAWITELQDYGRFRNITSPEAYRRLTHLLSRNLFAYQTAGKTQLEQKRLWAESYRITDISDADTETLPEYISFLYTAFSVGAINLPSPGRTFRTLSEELLRRSGLHPLHRQAITLSLQT